MDETYLVHYDLLHELPLVLINGLFLVISAAVQVVVVGQLVLGIPV